VPLTRSDRNIILVTSGALILAAMMFVGVLLFATRSDQPNQDAALYIGPRPDLERSIAEGGPLYFANPFGGRGFWLDREAGELVALDVGRPGDVGCSVKWKGRVNSYVDCDGERLTLQELARYDVQVLTRGARKGSVLVDLDARTLPIG
jgi:hypothetical protein